MLNNISPCVSLHQISFCTPLSEANKSYRQFWDLGPDGEASNIGICQRKRFEAEILALLASFMQRSWKIKLHNHGHFQHKKRPNAGLAPVVLLFSH